ncbi:uncharacterized protein LOC103787869 isoform X2 [Callithrix jacchus]
MAPLKPRRPRGGQQRVSAAGPARAPAPASTCGPRARHPPPPPPPPRPGPGPPRPAPRPRLPRSRPRPPTPRRPARGTPASLWASLRAPAKRAPATVRDARARRRGGLPPPTRDWRGGRPAEGTPRRSRSSGWRQRRPGAPAAPGTPGGRPGRVKFADSGLPGLPPPPPRPGRLRVGARRLLSPGDSLPSPGCSDGPAA